LKAVDLLALIKMVMETQALDVQEERRMMQAGEGCLPFSNVFAAFV
jgi:hypothetical protein